MYDPVMVQPMRDELTSAGFKELIAPEDVDALMADEKGTSLVFINSICGCAAGVARPAVIASLGNDIVPSNVTTAFAGNDVEAVERARHYFVGYPPSSPSIALFREGELVHMIERRQIEGQTVEVLSKMLASVYDKFCGESVNDSAEIYDPVADLEITVEEARQEIANGSDVVILDVREPYEIERGKIEGSTRIDQELAKEIVGTWPREREIIVYCEHGQRSLGATQYLRQQGFQNVRSLRGGFAVWSTAG